MILNGYQGISEAQVAITSIRQGESFKDVTDGSIYQLLSITHDGRSYVVQVRDYADGEVTELHYDGYDKFIRVANPPQMPAARTTHRKNLELFCRYTKLNLNPIYNSDTYREVSGASYKEITAKIKSYNKKFDQHAVATYNADQDSIIIRL